MGGIRWINSSCQASGTKKVDAKLNEDVLTITLNKREETKPRKIQVS